MFIMALKTKQIFYDELWESAISFIMNYQIREILSVLTLTKMEIQFYVSYGSDTNIL